MARKVKEAPFQPSGETRRVIPLQGGFAWLFDHLGKKHHLKRSSEEFVALCATEDEFFGGRIANELSELGWNEVLEALNNRKNESE